MQIDDSAFKYNVEIHKKGYIAFNIPGLSLMSDGVLSGQRRARLLRRNGGSELVCFRCGKVIEVGSRIHTNARSYSGVFPHPVRVYHAKCFDQMFIDL